MFLKVSPIKGSVRFGWKGKLTPRCIGTFEILQRIGPVAYRLALPHPCRLFTMSFMFQIFIVRSKHKPCHLVRASAITKSGTRGRTNENLGPSGANYVE